MDIFSATSKQVDMATSPKVATPTQVRQVEASMSSTKSAPDSQNGKTNVENLKKTVDELNNQMDKLDTNIKFGFNDKIDLMYVNVMEKSTGHSIRKIPTEEAMQLSEKMKEVVGMIFDKKG